MSLFIATTPVSLPSGEVADFSNWFTAADLGTAQTATVARDGSLAANTTYKALFSSTTAFGQCKISQIDQVTGEVITSASGGTAYAGGAGTGALPPQIAICVSLNTEFLVRTGRGRFYLPAPVTGTITATGRLVPANVATVVAAWRSAFDAMITAGGTPVVYSRKLRVAGAVVAINVGDVMDTMRTRRDKLFEVRQGVAIP